MMMSMTMMIRVVSSMMNCDDDHDDDNDEYDDYEYD